ncbi:MAG: hypothetical protein WDN46_13575 [Methylocella sp.]
MERVVFFLNGAPVEVWRLLVGALAIALALLAYMAISIARSARARSVDALSAAERQREMEQAMAVIARQNAELTGRVRSVAEVLGVAPDRSRAACGRTARRRRRARRRRP